MPSLPKRTGLGKPLRSEGETVPWWPLPPKSAVRAIDETTAQEMIDLIIETMRRVLNSGAQEYHIGSRGLKRLNLGDLKDLLDWWTQTKEDAAAGSSIKSRRAMPTDY